MKHYPFMQLAIAQAKLAPVHGDVPVGAVVVYDGHPIAQAYNQREVLRSPAAHAEILALEAAAKYLNDWRLNSCDLYVTLEPCAMCAGAILQSRLRRCYFGSYDVKAGAFGGAIDLTLSMDCQTEVYGGIMEAACNQMLQDFFTNLRRK